MGLLRAVKRNTHDFFGSPYYRKRPLEALRFVRAKWEYKTHRVRDPREFLRRHGIDPDPHLRDLDLWKPVLGAVISDVSRARGAQGAVSAYDGAILYAIVRYLKPAVVIETGIAAGVSTSFLLAALSDNQSGSLYSIDLPANERSHISKDADGSRFEWHTRGLGWAIPSSLREAMGDRHTVLLGNVRIVLPDLLSTLAEVNLFFHDDLHTPDHMFHQYQTVWRKLGPGGMLVSDDVNWGWISFCKQERLDPSNYLLNLDRLALCRKPEG